MHEERKSARRPLWILLLLVLLTSCRLIMALLSDPVPQRVPPSTEPRGRKVTLRSTPRVISCGGAYVLVRGLALSAYPNVAGCRPFGCFIRRVADLD